MVQLLDSYTLIDSSIAEFVEDYYNIFSCPLLICVSASSAVAAIYWIFRIFYIPKLASNLRQKSVETEVEITLVKRHIS